MESSEAHSHEGYVVNFLDPSEPVAMSLLKAMAPARADGRVCPHTEPWVRFWEVLNGAAGATDRAPKPFLLNGLYASDYAKSEQVLEQLAWASRHGMLDRAARYLRDLRPTDWYRVECVHACEPVSFPHFVSWDGHVDGCGHRDSNVLSVYIQRVIQSGICVRLKAHGCGNIAFKQGLDVICAQLSGWRGFRLDIATARALIDSLASFEAVSFLNASRGREAVRVCIFHLWCSLGSNLFESMVAPELLGTWSGTQLDEMRRHSAWKQSL